MNRNLEGMGGWSCMQEQDLQVLFGSGTLNTADCTAALQGERHLPEGEG